MLDDISQDTAVSRLQAASKDMALSASSRRHARQLAERLTHGVRIVLLGPSGVGKSTLCDAILGRSEADAGSVTRSFTTGLADPSYTLSGQQTNSGLLGHAQVIDVAAPKDSDAFEECMEASIATADIVIWCTQNFNEQEARVWQSAPDPLKDHSFLVLTKADLLAGKRILREEIKALQPVVSEEFHSFFPVTTSRLRQLQQAGEPVPASVLAASGIKALIDTVASLVSSGQRADLDSAMLFLERQGLTLDDPMPPRAAARPEPESLEDPSPLKAACKAPRERLMERAFDIAELGFDEADGDMSGVLEMCGSISEDLTEDMRHMAREHPELTPWTGEFEAASDKIMLMTMENDTRSAADAVTILLQLRRDLDHLSFQ